MIQWKRMKKTRERSYYCINPTWLVARDRQCVGLSLANLCRNCSISRRYMPSWTILKADERKLEAFHMQCQRRLGIRWSTWQQSVHAGSAAPSDQGTPGFVKWRLMLESLLTRHGTLPSTAANGGRYDPSWSRKADDDDDDVAKG